MPLSAASRPKDRKEKAVRKDDGSIEDQSGSAFEPNYIYKMLNNIRSDAFKVEGRQEDAEEFLGCLLNGLNDEMLEVSFYICLINILIFIFKTRRKHIKIIYIINGPCWSSG